MIDDVQLNYIIQRCQVILNIEQMLQSLENQKVYLDSENKYIRLSPIGSGNFGIVYQGFDNIKKQLVALKYIPNNRVENWQKQVDVLSILQHPNVIKYEGYIIQKSPFDQSVTGIYIVTEYFRGVTLSRYIKENKKVQETGLSQISVLQIFGQLLEGYGYIHQMKIVHRDIKPENILIGLHEDVKIIDFGQSKEQKLLKTRGLGTPLYCAPETFTQIVTDFRRDVWSLGLVLYEMITGRCYFEQWAACQDEMKFVNHLKSVKMKIKFPSSFNSFWEHIVKRMLKKDFKQRPNIHEIILQFTEIKPLLYKLFKDRGQDRSAKQEYKKNSGYMINNLENVNPLKQSQNQFELSRTKRYLLFFREKYRFLVLLSDLLRKYNYPFLSNAHKFILVFVSLNIYSAAIEHLLRRFDQNKIVITQNEQFDVSEFQQPYHSDMKQYLKFYRDYFQRQLRITRDTILQKIIPNLSKSQKQNSMSNENSGRNMRKQKPINPQQLLQLESYHPIKELIQDFKRGKNYDKNSYLKIFQSMMGSPDFYHSQQNIRLHFYEEDMVIYYLLMIICHIDDFIHWKREFIGDQLSKLRQELLKRNRTHEELEILIGKIQKYNKKILKQ